MAKSAFTEVIIELIRAIPPGTVSTYGRIAEMAGSPRAARQVVRVLHTYSETESLPWHRVINRDGKIALLSSEQRNAQRELLEKEGVEFDTSGRIDLDTYLWQPDDDWDLDNDLTIDSICRS